MQSQIVLDTYCKVAKNFGTRVNYTSNIDTFGVHGIGETLVSNRTLWSEWYSSCCATILFKEDFGSLSHRNLKNETGYDIKKDIESTLNEMSKTTGISKIFGFVVGGNPEHMKEVMGCLNEFKIAPLNDGSYFSPMRRSLVVVPRTRRIIVCETEEPSNKAFKKSYKILN